MPNYDENDPQIGETWIRSSAHVSADVQLHGEQPNDGFGIAVAGTRDISGNGAHDVLVGAPLFDQGGGVLVGRVYLFQGADGTLVHQFTGTHPRGFFGTSVAEIGDVTGDGVPDVAIGAPGAGPNEAGKVYVYSGADGTLLHELLGESRDDGFGYAIARAGKINGDNVDDLVVSAPYFDGAGRDIGAVYVIDGALGTVISRQTGKPHYGYFGIAVTGGTDMTGDGIDDLGVGLPATTNPDTQQVSNTSGQVYLFSGIDLTTDGDVLDAMYAYTPSISGDAYFGGAVHAGNDVNDDGVDDLITGASNEAIEDEFHFRIYAFDGTTGALIEQWIPQIDTTDLPLTPLDGSSCPEYVYCAQCMATTCGGSSDYCWCALNALSKYHQNRRGLALRGMLIALGCGALGVGSGIVWTPGVGMGVGYGCLTWMLKDLNDKAWDIRQTLMNDWYNCWNANGCSGVSPAPPILF